MDSWQPRQSHSRKVRFVMPWMRTHGPHIMQGSFAGPEGNLSFQPWKMRNRLGTLTQARDWMAITCVVGFAFPPWKIKMFSLENGRWILAVSRLKTSKQTKLQRKICTFWVCMEGSRAGESSTGIPGRVSGLSSEVVLTPHVSILCLSVSSGQQELCSLCYLCVQVPHVAESCSFHQLCAFRILTLPLYHPHGQGCPCLQQAVKTPVWRWYDSFLVCLHGFHLFFTWMLH